MSASCRRCCAPQQPVGIMVEWHDGWVAWLRSRRRREPAQGSESSGGVRHLVVAAGRADEWSEAPGSVALSPDWLHRLSSVAASAAAHGVSRVTVVPFEGVVPDTSPVRVDDGATTLIADRSTDGRGRIVEASVRFAPGTRVSEQMLSKALVGDAGEPDLVVVVGDGRQLPSSLVWELAYAEIVFVDIAFAELDAAHVATAIDEFSLRHRRFGGVDE